MKNIFLFRWPIKQQLVALLAFVSILLVLLPRVQAQTPTAYPEDYKVVLTTSCGIGIAGDYSYEQTFNGRAIYKKNGDDTRIGFSTRWRIFNQQIANGRYFSNSASSSLFPPTTGWVGDEDGSCYEESASIRFVCTLTAAITLSSQTITSGSSVTLTASGGADSYTWSNGETDNPLILNEVILTTPLSVTGVRRNCSATASAEVTVTQLVVTPVVTPAITTSPISDSIISCAGTPVAQQFTVSGTNLTADLVATAPPEVQLSTNATTGFGPTVTLSPSGGSVQSTTIYVRAAPTTMGTFVSKAISLTSTGAAARSVILIGVVRPLPPVSIMPASPVITSGESVTLTASGATSYTWSNGQRTTAITVSPTSSTAFSVTGVTDGCSATASAAISVTPAAPVASATICVSGGCEAVNGTYVEVATPSIPDYIVNRALLNASKGVYLIHATVKNDNVWGFIPEGKDFPIYVNDADVADVQIIPLTDWLGLGDCEEMPITLSQGACVVSSPCTSLPDVTIVFPQSASVNPAGPVITVPVGAGLSYQVVGGGVGARYERRIVLDRINGYEIRTTMENRDGIFPIDKAGPYTITVTDGNGCSRTVTGEIRGQ